MINFLKKMANPTRLSLATLYDVVIAAAAAFLCYVAVTNAMGLLAGMMTDQKNYYERHTKLLAEEFQDFVTENHVEIGDGETIGDWNSENWYVFLTVYQRDRIYYNTMDRDNEKLKTELKDEHPGFQYGYLYRHGTAVTYPVKFADGDGEILIRAYFEARFRTLILVLGAGMSAVCFVVVFLVLLQKKLAYIRQIEKGIHILETGSRGYEIPLKGRDELYSLADSINQMSESLHKEIEEKDRIEKERSEIVTALSHDIRTPLTSVLFYLDLITAGKCTADESVLYMEKAKRQAYHMKNLMDDLFSYSYATGDRFSLKNEEYDGNELFGQLIGDLTESLEEHGFRTEVRYEIETPFAVETDVVQLKRVLNNIGTNIEKYARRDGIVSVEVRLSDGFVCLNIENPIRDEEIEVESYGIGVKASEQMIEKMGGSFSYESHDYRYHTSMKLPEKEWNEEQFSVSKRKNSSHDKNF